GRLATQVAKDPRIHLIGYGRLTPPRESCRRRATLGPYSHDPLPVEQQVRGPDARHDLEVAPAPGRAQEGTRRRRTPTAKSKRGSPSRLAYRRRPALTVYAG